MVRKPSLLPQPQSLTPRAGTFRVPAAGVIGICDMSLYQVAVELQRVLPGLAVNASYPGSHDTVALALRDGLKRDAYRLAIGTDGIRIEAGAVCGAFYAVQTLHQLLARSPAGRLPTLEIDDWPDFADRGVYYDVTRGRVPKLAQLLEMADQLSRYKINQLQLYIEHTFLFRGHPDIGKDASPLTAEDILRLDAHCRARHIELVPSLASFGHLSTVLKYPQYHALAEDWGVGRFVDPDAPAGWGMHGWTLTPANPDSYVFLDSLFAEFLPLFSSKRFNACCDETYDLGWGQSYELCRQRGKGRVYLDHIAKVAALAGKYGKSLMFWGDIIRHHPELIADIPKDVTVLDWGYGHNHHFEAIRDFKQAGLSFYACPGTNSWGSLFPRLPEARGNIAGFAAAGRKHGASGLLNTDWGDGGHYNFMEYSWHGYLFGAEQAWNVGADQPSFTRRFAERFLCVADPQLAAALDELGEISLYGVSGYGACIWHTLLFALPDDPVFQRPQPADGTFICGGAIVAARYRLNAALARSLLPRLEKIRAAFAAREGEPGVDPNGVLPYWIFAADTIRMAVRKLAAFGPGAQPGPAEPAAIRRGLCELRTRFQQLWLARNRPSEIGITLVRYDRVIRGDCVRTTLTEAGPNRIRLTVTNSGPRAAAGTVQVKALPADAATFAGPAAFRFARLQPGASRSAEFALKFTGPCGKIRVEAAGSGPDLIGAALVIYGARDWTIPVLAAAPARPEALPGLLAAVPARAIRIADNPVAEVRAALAGKALALVVTVNDAAVRRGEPVWSGSCVEVFGSLGGTAVIGQVLLAPPTEAAPAAAFKVDGAIVRAPEIKLATTASGATGYTLSALVPLALLRIPAGSRTFRLEVVVTARTAGRTEHRRASLFYAVDEAFSNSSGFGFVRAATLLRTTPSA